MITITQLTIDALMHHPEPTIRYRTRLALLDEDPGSPGIHQLHESIRTSPIVSALLSELTPEGTLPHHPYKKWTGAHWVLTSLSEVDYPPGDQGLLPLRNQVFAWLFSLQHLNAIKAIEGRTRRCASMEANALFSSIKLGLIDEQTHQLAQSLLRWQWPDGGWNCDRNPSAHNSSFFETITPLRALSLYAKTFDHTETQQALPKIAEVFLKRSLFRSLSSGEAIYAEFLELAYPCFWYYNILHALSIMDDAGFLADPRCTEALDILEAKQLPDGGFPSERRWYKSTNPEVSGYTPVNWGGISRRKMHPWVTLQALTILKHAGRLKILSN